MEQKRHSDSYKVMTASPKTFGRITLRNELQERPLLMNAWTQTTGDDFQTLWECNQSEQYTKREQELLDKIRYLEDSLKQHADILAQIHATAARRGSLHVQQQHAQVTYNNESSATPSSHNLQYQHSQQQQQTHSRNSSPSNAAVINSVQSITEHNKESVKYTIIAERHCNVVEGPIEIQLAHEESALLNASDDSGRLEICLADDTTEIKNELTGKEETLKYTEIGTQAQETQTIKRRKISYNEQLHQEQQQRQQEHAAQQALYQHEQQHMHSPALNYYNESGNTKILPTHANEKIKLLRQHCPTKANKLSLLKVNKSENGLKDYPQQSQQLNQSHSKIDIDNVMVSIGPNNSRISAKLYENMNWSSASIATRKLLMALFGRQTLATHSMTGKPSPAFKDHGKPLKQMLDPHIIQDIIFAVTRKCNVSEKEVRNAITTKCADENKMMKLQENKQRSLKELVDNKENMCA